MMNDEQLIELVQQKLPEDLSLDEVRTLRDRLELPGGDVPLLLQCAYKRHRLIFCQCLGSVRLNSVPDALGGEILSEILDGPPDSGQEPGTISLELQEILKYCPLDKRIATRQRKWRVKETRPAITKRVNDAS